MGSTERTAASQPGEATPSSTVRDVPPRGEGDTNSHTAHRWHSWEAQHHDHGSASPTWARLVLRTGDTWAGPFSRAWLRATVHRTGLHGQRQTWRF